MHGPYKNLLTLTIVLCKLLVPVSDSAVAEKSKFWPAGKVGAVSLTFDDGMPSQLEQAIPLLRKYGLKGTFYVNPNYSLNWTQSVRLWQQVVLEGHEIGNHTDSHPCSCRHHFRNNRNFCLERMTLTDIATSIDSGSSALRKLFRGSLVDRTFAYPCNESFVGMGTTRKSYVPEVARRYVAGRGEYSLIGNDPLEADLSFLYSHGVEGMKSVQISELIEHEILSGRWVILTFHGIGKEWLPIKLVEFERMLNYLRKNRSRIWIAPVAVIANYILSQRRRKG
ncbi:MAG: polysaccharide deacetylase family protein [Nitrospinota bacterium]